MVPLSLQPFDLITLKTFENLGFNERGKQVFAVKYRSPKGQVFVAVLLGCMPIATAQTFDVDKLMEEMGWKFVGDAEAKP